MGVRERDPTHTAQVKPRNAFTPSRRSGTQAGTARLRGLTPPSRASALSRAGDPLLAPDPPSHGKRTRLRQPTRKPSPTSHLQAHDAQSGARPSVPALPPRAPLPRAPDVACAPLRPGVKPTRRPPPHSTRSTLPPPPGPARAHTPPGPLSAARAHSRGHAHSAPQLDRPGRAARSRGRPRPLGRPVLSGGARGRGRETVAVGPHSPPSRAGSECAAFRCEPMRYDARGPRFSAAYGGDGVGVLRSAGVSLSRFTSQNHGDPRN